MMSYRTEAQLNAELSSVWQMNHLHRVEIATLTAKLEAAEKERDDFKENMYQVGQLAANQLTTINELTSRCEIAEREVNVQAYWGIRWEKAQATIIEQAAQIEAMKVDVNLFDALLTEMLAIEIDGPIMSSLESLVRHHDNANTLPTIVEIKEAISTAVVKS